jgi:antitoxin (DNA-binding transcriptional repressor) of toxin-antitoxin stability system
MYHRPDENHKTMRDARAHLSALVKLRKSTVILANRLPVAILVPIYNSKLDWATPSRHDLAAIKRDIKATLDGLMP